MTGSEVHRSQEAIARGQIEKFINSQRPDLALKVFTSLTPDQQKDLSILSLIGWTYYDLGDRAKARLFLSKVLDDEEKTPIVEAQASHFVGKCDLDEGNLVQARARFERSLEIYRDLNQPGAEAFNHLYVAKVDVREAKFQHASAEINTAQDLFVASKPSNNVYLSHIFMSLAEVEAAQGHSMQYLIFAALAAVNAILTVGPEITANYLKRITRRS